ncbi:hypothetical protein MMC14_009247 [Varicellaria rhodocarpa]|nr:hypothetical protein [Varicellaria rhodocarpa]
MTQSAKCKGRSEGYLTSITPSSKEACNDPDTISSLPDYSLTPPLIKDPSPPKATMLPIYLPSIHLLVSFATALLLMHYIPLSQIYILIISALIFWPLVHYLLNTFTIFGDMPLATSGDDDHQDFPPPPPPLLSRHPAFRDQDMYGHWDVAPTVKAETVISEDSTRGLDGHSDVHRDAVMNGGADGPARRTRESEDAERLTGGNSSNTDQDTVRDRRTVRRTNKFEDLNASVACPLHTTVSDRHSKAPERRSKGFEDLTTPVDGPPINWGAVPDKYRRPAVRTANDSEDSTAPVKCRSGVHEDLSRKESTTTIDNPDSSTASIDYRSGRRQNLGREESAGTTDNSEGSTDPIDPRSFYESTSSSSDFDQIDGPSGVLARPPPVLYEHEEWVGHVAPERKRGIRERMAEHAANNSNLDWRFKKGQS